MAEFKRTVRVAYQPHQMYDLVDAIELYPEFLPWCERARIDHRDDAQVEATLGFKQVGFRGDFTTRNTLNPKHRIEMELLDGPFDQLKGWWGFTEKNYGSDVSLFLSYRFENPLAGFMFATVVETIASELVTAFAERAETVYSGYD
ncbi:MAG: type II toxin-antitoxin system RatA family toxin [Gammaproteobacteria bacterium]|nr:type II toxin-antitoxin system RatA family toxin [Gammaproteobacteria bacterium]